MVPTTAQPDETASNLQSAIQAAQNGGKSGRAIERDAAIANGQVSLIMAGGQPQLDTYRKLAPVLGKPLWWLLEIEQPPAADATGSGEYFALDQIYFGGPDSLNPRKHFDAEGIASLADEMFADGQLQNLVVRATGGGTHDGRPMVELLAGERRIRAAHLLVEQKRWPQGALMACKVIEANDQRAAVIALAENIHREDLTPLEIGEWLENLAKTDTEIWDNKSLSALIRKKVGFVQQHRRIATELPDDMKEQLRKGQISFTQAREHLQQPRAANMADAKVTIAGGGKTAAGATRSTHSVRGFTGTLPSAQPRQLHHHHKALKDVPLEFVSVTWGSEGDSLTPSEVKLWNFQDAMEATYIRSDVVDRQLEAARSSAAREVEDDAAEPAEVE
ncbi:MAG TPA: ParB/Srx family N-terminal domain-containing protein [Alphaproteobacteria bacterium]|jgi:ParB/RepB/Spo0J family partition protein